MSTGPYCNQAQPEQDPGRQCDPVPVIARLVDSDGAEWWWPAVIHRSSRDGQRVLIAWLPNPVDPGSQDLIWLSVADVSTMLRAPAAPTG